MRFPAVPPSGAVRRSSRLADDGHGAVDDGDRPCCSRTAAPRACRRDRCRVRRGHRSRAHVPASTRRSRRGRCSRRARAGSAAGPTCCKLRSEASNEYCRVGQAEWFHRPVDGGAPLHRQPPDEEARRRAGFACRHARRASDTNPMATVAMYSVRGSTRSSPEAPCRPQLFRSAMSASRSPTTIQWLGTFRPRVLRRTRTVRATGRRSPTRSCRPARVTGAPALYFDLDRSDGSWACPKPKVTALLQELQDHAEDAHAEIRARVATERRAHLGQRLGAAQGERRLSAR